MPYHTTPGFCVAVCKPREANASRHRAPRLARVLHAFYTRVCLFWFIVLRFAGRPEPSGFTSNIKHWGYIHDNDTNEADAEVGNGRGLPHTARSDLSQTLAVMQTLCDVPLYHTSTWQDVDFEEMAAMFRACAAETAAL